MTRLAFLRHGPTAWNAEGRLQGRHEVPLGERARADLASLAVPAAFRDAVWHASPLGRARDTARLLGGVPRVEPRLIEMAWGDFEGERLADLRRRLGPALARNEARGLDFEPPGGESPRAVQRRLIPWLQACAAEGGSHLAVTHKGVIRAVLALAYDWDMRDKAPVRLDWRALHVFELDGAGAVRPHEMNLALERR